ncbi:helix-turn-helix domain-containing protein [Flexivirga endophytica]|uniref:helix-turn-helix domain-containing protein n=1 Tax=Flexivirga endophytica TaxID=1849103 RepID=UPI003570A666
MFTGQGCDVIGIALGRRPYGCCVPDFSPSALRSARVRAGLTQHELARLVGVSGGERVSVWERGEMAPRARTVSALAIALNVSVEELLGIASEAPDLRALRRRVALSTAEVAESAFVSTSTYERWERGVSSRMPGVDSLRGMAAKLAVDQLAVRRAFQLAVKNARHA